LVPGVLGLALLTACGAGQITQTDTQSSAVNGDSGMAGPLAVRNAQLAFPANTQGIYEPGSSARVIVTIVNTGLTADTLTKITSPAAVSVTIDGSTSGDKLVPGDFSVASGTDADDSFANAAASAVPTTTTPTPSASVGAGEPGSPASGAASPSGSVSPSVSVVPSASAAPSAPGRITIELVGIKSINGGALRPGLTIPITFYFAHAGQVTLGHVPIGDAPDRSGNS
jgi:hypothetical protein